MAKRNLTFVTDFEFSNLLIKKINMTRFNSLTKNMFPGILIMLTIILFGSCARKIAFQTSPVVPAARGYTQVKKDKNNNYVIKIQVSNLSEVKRLEPPKDTYVIWMETDGNMAKNIGQLNSSTNFMSNKLKASFETVSPTKPTKIFITAENDASTQYPGNQVVLSTSAF